LLQQLQLQGLRSVVRAGLDVTIRGQDGKKALRQALKNTVTSALGAHLAGKIGQMYRGENPSLDYAGHKVMHGFLGGALGALSSEGKLEGIIAGAGAAVMAEVVAEARAKDLPERVRNRALTEASTTGQPFPIAYENALQDELQNLVDLGKFTAALCAFAAGQDVDIAARTAAKQI
jgi:hypothetical protein